MNRLHLSGSMIEHIESHSRKANHSRYNLTLFMLTLDVINLSLSSSSPSESCDVGFSSRRETGLERSCRRSRPRALPDGVGETEASAFFSSFSKVKRGKTLQVSGQPAVEQAGWNCVCMRSPRLSFLHIGMCVIRYTRLSHPAATKR